MSLAIYGAGAFGKIFFESLELEVDFFIDDHTTESVCLGKPIKKISEVSSDTLVYISVLQHSKNIEKNLNRYGFTQIISFTQAIKKIPNILTEISKSNYLWLVEDHSKMINEVKLKSFKNLLKDQKSKDLLEQIINLRKTLDPKYYVSPHGIEYFPSDVPILKNLEEINFIDCGAYTGDTVKELMNQKVKVNSSISFEPEIKNQKKLNKELELQKSNYPDTNFLIYPVGVYSKNCILQFSNNGVDSSASFSNKSNMLVPVVSIDNTLINSNVNFIKMDIEGAEAEALKGSKKTIQKYKPNLAICLYHKPEDLWELPLLINEIEPSYNMYLRVHEDMCLSTVLYCIGRTHV